MPLANESGGRSSTQAGAGPGGVRNRKRGVFETIKASTKKATNALMQQRLKSWQPVLTPKYVHMTAFHSHFNLQGGSFALSDASVSYLSSSGEFY